MITVVDTLMGGGKSSYVIDYMNTNRDIQFMYVTPLNSEVDRICENVGNIYKCDVEGVTKLEQLKSLVADGASVSITHELFKRFDKEMLDILSAKPNTCLIIDETLDCYSKIKVSRLNIQVLLDQGVIEVEQMPNGVFKVNAVKCLKGLSQSDQLYKKIANREVFTNNMTDLLVTMLPSDIYICVDNVFILTYNFEGTDMSCYLKFKDCEYTTKSVSLINGKYTLVDYYENTGESYRHLINILDAPKMNAIGDKKGKGYPLSKGWYTGMVTKPKTLKILNNHCVNFFKNRVKTGVSDNMVALFKDSSGYEFIYTSEGDYAPYEDYSGKKVSSSRWRDKVLSAPFKDTRNNICEVSFNIRATNDYAHKVSCAFLIDVHFDQSIIGFFHHYNIVLDSDKYALNTLLQWLWRSRIRKGEPINLYIPSRRMRTLLLRWLGYTEDELF